MKIADIRRSSLRTRVQLVIESVREPMSVADIAAHPLIAGSAAEAVRRQLRALFHEGKAAVYWANRGQPNKWIAYPRPRRGRAPRAP